MILLVWVNIYLRTLEYYKWLHGIGMFKYYERFVVYKKL